jgi:hypothetical protein
MLETATTHNRPEIRYAWRGPSFLIVDNEGRIGTGDFQGFFFRETRYLSELKLEIQGQQPFLCSIGQAAQNEIDAAYLFPQVPGGKTAGGKSERHEVLTRDLDASVRYRVRPASVEAVLEIGNRWQEHAEVELAWLIAADFITKGDAQGQKIKVDAPTKAEAKENGVVFRFEHEKYPLETHITARGGGTWSYDGHGRLSTRITLPHQETIEIRLVVRAVDSEDPIDETGEERREKRLEEWFRSITRLHAPGKPRWWRSPTFPCATWARWRSWSTPRRSG